MWVQLFLYSIAVSLIGLALLSQSMWLALQSMNPFFFASIGCMLSISMPIFGAAWGIFTTGSAIAGASVQAPQIRSKNLISVIFCEAVAIYGVIVAIIQTSKMEPQDDFLSMLHDRVPMKSLAKTSGYKILCTGMTIGFGCLACGISIGILGSACAIGDAAKSSLFIKFLIMEIFASAFGIFALIVAILQVQGAKF